MWELDYKESWVPNNWCFCTVVLEKTLENPLNYKEIHPVHPNGNQSWMFIWRTDVEAETPIFWPPDAKNWLTGKDTDARKDWRQEKCCRKRDPFQGPKVGSCLTLGNELSEETHMLTKQEILLGKGTWVESSRVREPRRTALPHGSQCRVLRWWDYFPGGLWPIILIQNVSWWRTHRSAKMDASERDSGKWTGMQCLL